jgi:hypothetical protein
MTTSIEIPVTPGEITATWLTDALRAGGAIPASASVSRAPHEVLGQGAGFIGQIARFTLEYDGDARNAPRTLIAKLPALDPGAREVAALYGLYEREYRFYQELASEMPFRIARCYHAAGDAEAVRYVLLLEDLAASGSCGDQVSGCTAEQASLALSQLARFHAQWWAHPRLTQISWLQPGVDLVNAGMRMSYPNAWQLALERFGDRMPQQIRDIVPTLNTRITMLMEGIAGAMTIAHGDYRLDNMFFGNPDAGYSLAVLDWQSPNQGWGAYDIAYFVYGNIPVETRRAHEHEFLREYHDTLIANGVTGYSYDALFQDYRKSLLVSLGIWVVNAATLDTANERGRALFDLFFDRLSAAIMDLDALALLPE